MFTWLATKAFLKKAWTWLKHNWYVPLIIVYTLFLWVLFRRKDEALKVLEIRSESYKAQIETINKIHAEEIKKRDEILKKYAETVKKLEDEYIKNNKELDEKKKKEVKEIVEKYYNDPDTLANMISDKFGF
tara:strand:+ start:3971 stop:4363 length:393 start_codon:yes stop_codon:yes gene_type:complete